MLRFVSGLNAAAASYANLICVFLYHCYAITTGGAEARLEESDCGPHFIVYSSSSDRKLNNGSVKL
jgi:hypothetical protein